MWLLPKCDWSFATFAILLQLVPWSLLSNSSIPKALWVPSVKWVNGPIFYKKPMPQTWPTDMKHKDYIVSVSVISLSFLLDWILSDLETGGATTLSLYYWVGTDLPLICKWCCWWAWSSNWPLCPYLSSGMSPCYPLWVSADWVTTSLYSSSMPSVPISMGYEKMCLVMCPARPKARSQAKPSLFGPGQARPLVTAQQWLWPSSE